METDVTIKRITSAAQMECAQSIRDRVFVNEQGIPAELEHDADDKRSTHVLAVAGDSAVGTARITVNDNGEAVVARVAVLAAYRATGVGQRLVRELEKCAVEQNVRRIELHPHHYLEKFYAKLGYARVGGFSEVGTHRLITMEKFLVP